MPTSISILIFLAVWGRPKITELCFMGIDRLRQTEGFVIDALAVISEPEMIPLCEKYRVRWVMADNLPLGKKKNTGLQEAKKLKFDYMMEVGSDDLVLDLEQYRPILIEGKEKFVGVHDMAFIDSDTGACRRWISASTFGAGRLIRRDVLESTDWKLWDDNISKALDNNSVERLEAIGIEYEQLPPLDYPRVVDVKSSVNIWPFNHLYGSEYPIENIIEKLSEPEKKLLRECLEG